MEHTFGRRKSFYLEKSAITGMTVEIPSTKNITYILSSEGKIYSLDKRSKRVRQLKLSNTSAPSITINTYTYSKQGYLSLRIILNNKRVNQYVHRLVAKYFCPNDDPEHKTQVDHIDGCRGNNDYRNLEWVTPDENRRRLRDNKGWKPYSEARKASAQEVHRRAKQAHWQRKQRLQESNLFNN